MHITACIHALCACQKMSQPGFEQSISIYNTNKMAAHGFTHKIKLRPHIAGKHTASQQVFRAASFCRCACLACPPGEVVRLGSGEVFVHQALDDVA